MSDVGCWMLPLCGLSFFAFLPSIISFWLPPYLSYPPCESGGVMNNNINVSGQLELGFNGSGRAVPTRRQQTRIERATWWFNKMRATVDNAMSWSSKPTPPPQQIWLAQ